jgi:hypothetical protein
MNDPFDMDLKYLIKRATDQHGILNPVLALLIEEVMGYRTAQAASAERVRQVVLQAFAQLSEGIGVVVISRIASHVASQLAPQATNYADATSAERVRQVVLQAFAQLSEGIGVVVIGRIANHVASQLSTHTANQRDLDVACYAEVKRERDVAVEECSQLRSQLSAQILSATDRALILELRHDARKPTHEDDCEPCGKRRATLALLDRLLGAAC